jgi:S-(hydroxymethyl)glutathione dehydrogenase / alcohol dehydrogenase
MGEIRATGICHTDEFTLSGADPGGLFPAIPGHEDAGIVVEDRAILHYAPACRACPSCLSRKTK